VSILTFDLIVTNGQKVTILTFLTKWTFVMSVIPWTNRTNWTKYIVMGKEGDLIHLKTEIPARTHQKIRLWVAQCEDRLSQADLLIYAFENLPPMPKLVPNSAVANLIKKPGALKGLTPDEKKVLNLIAKGIIKATTEDKQLIEKITKELENTASKPKR
jgi:hypothetical protein